MIVKDIPFQVNGQVIKFSTAAQLVANSAGIATASFSFSTDWSDYEIIKVIFSNGETKKSKILTTGQYTVTIPSECMTAGRITVSAVGLTGAEGEETFKRATTERNNGVEVVPSGAFEGDPAGLPTPTEAEEILLIATNANTLANQANATANGANTKSNTALENSEEALSTADEADDKAQEALDKLPYAITGETIYGGTIATNLDTIVKNGFYTCYGGATGAPGTTTSWFVIHQNSNAGTITATQKATSFGEELDVYRRKKIGSVWQLWKRVPDTRYKGLRLAHRTIVGAATPIIEFDKDDDGNPLNSALGGELLFYSGENASITTNVSFFLQFNKITSSSFWSNSSAASPYILLGTAGNVFSELRADVDVVNQNVIINSRSAFRTSSSGGIATGGGGIIPPQTAVTAMKLLLSAGTFPAGTVVEWWERG